MSYFTKIEYEIILKDSFRVIRSCPKCGGKTHFKNTGKFRVNANGNKLDVWLIYQCEQCKHTLNLTIYERKKVSSVSKEEYRRFLNNDQQLAEIYGKNMQLFRKNQAEIDFDSVSYDFEKRREAIEGSETMESSEILESSDAMESGDTSESSAEGELPVITINNPYQLKLRPEKQIAGLLKLSRSQVKDFINKGEIEILEKQSQLISFRIHSCRFL